MEHDIGIIQRRFFLMADGEIVLTVKFYDTEVNYYIMLFSNFYIGALLSSKRSEIT
jgi:hypothetical protein